MDQSKCRIFISNPVTCSEFYWKFSKFIDSTCTGKCNKVYYYSLFILFSVNLMIYLGFVVTVVLLHPTLMVGVFVWIVFFPLHMFESNMRFNCFVHVYQRLMKLITGWHFFGWWHCADTSAVLSRKYLHKRWGWMTSPLTFSYFVSQLEFSSVLVQASKRLLGFHNFLSICIVFMWDHTPDHLSLKDIM